MSKQTVFDVLNRLIANQCYSLVNYLNEARPWTHPGNEELTEAIRNIVADHEHYSRLLADAIEERGGMAYFFLVSRVEGASLSVKITSSSPVTVLMS